MPIFQRTKDPRRETDAEIRPHPDSKTKSAITTSMARTLPSRHLVGEKKADERTGGRYV